MFEELRGIIIEEPRHYHSPIAVCPKTDLQTLYQQGWWITEIFGSYAVLVALSQCTTRKNKRPYFICIQSHINISQITPKAQRTIKKIKKQQWNKYKKYLLGQDDE